MTASGVTLAERADGQPLESAAPEGPASYLLGIDIGGTFTDFVLVDSATNRTWVTKHLTTPDDPARAVRAGVDDLRAQVGITGADLHLVVHGTTLIVNALTERRGVRTGLITTDGYRDVLQIGTEHRYDSHDLSLERPEPLAERPLRYDVPERVLPSGQVLTPLDEEALCRVAQSLREADVQAVAICFLHSFTNPAHEQRARELLVELLPGVPVSLSSEVAPEIREYPRMSTTVANAYVQPIAERYLHRLHGDLAEGGYARPLYLMLSSGGIATHETAARFPIRLIESGPAAGALGTVMLGRGLSRRNLIAFDMGGTTAKAVLIDDGAVTTAKEYEIARVKRFKKGSGIPLQVPVIEMIEIGAGGGSLARRGEMGLLKVGPESAGADPGPACYGRGGTEPTVTDADLLLGYLDADSFLGGRMKLNRAAAQTAIESLAVRLGVTPERAVRGIFDVVNANMVAAAKVHLSERGRDPRGYSMVAYGGMGPMHAHAVAANLKVREVICPASAGVLSAWGMLVAPISFEFSRSVVGTLADDLLARAEAVFEAMKADAVRMLAEAGVTEDQISFKRSADMRFAGQNRELTVPLPDGGEPLSVESAGRTFADEYRRVYGHAHIDVAIQLVTCRLVATSPERRVTNRSMQAAGDDGQGDARKGDREVYFEGAGGYVPATVYDRYRLRPEASFEGPAIVEETESTAVVPPGARARVDDELNLIIDLGAEVPAA